MKVKRIMANTATSDLKKAAAFYRDILGLDLVMDHGWFQTYGSEAMMTVQVSFGTEGGSSTPVPDLSIEVDDLEVALARFKKANVLIEYGPVSETGSMYAIHSESLLTFCNTNELGCTLNKALQRTRFRSGRVFRRLISLAAA